MIDPLLRRHLTLAEDCTGILKEPSLNEFERWVSWLLIRCPGLLYAEACREWIWRVMEASKKEDK